METRRTKAGVQNKACLANNRALKKGSNAVRFWVSMDLSSLLPPQGARRRVPERPVQGSIPMAPGTVLPSHHLIKQFII